jgi:hypothetical protein
MVMPACLTSVRPFVQTPVLNLKVNFFKLIVSYLCLAFIFYLSPIVITELPNTKYSVWIFC